MTPKAFEFMIDALALLKHLNDSAESYQKYYGLPYNPGHPLVPDLLDHIAGFVKPLEQKTVDLERSLRNVSFAMDMSQLNCLLVGHVEDQIQLLIEYTQLLE